MFEFYFFCPFFLIIFSSSPLFYLIDSCFFIPTVSVYGKCTGGFELRYIRLCKLPAFVCRKYSVEFNRIDFKVCKYDMAHQIHSCFDDHNSNARMTNNILLNKDIL